jgi:hypothetical protein
LGDLFLTACISEIDLALRETVENLADYMGRSECQRHRGIHLETDLIQILEMTPREHQRLGRIVR